MDPSDALQWLDRLKHFLCTAPQHWGPQHRAASSASSSTDASEHHPALNRFQLPSGDYVSCVLWDGLYHITGTDIVRALVFRFEAFGRPVRNMKKFEEGVFSDLRNLKPGLDASLEEPKSPFLDLLFKYQCIRTQKKQKVFYWYSVPHDRLFLDALERDLKRQRSGQEVTTYATSEPALSFSYDPRRTLYEQFIGPAADRENEGSSKGLGQTQVALAHHLGRSLALFEGSPSYKLRRRKRAPNGSSNPSSAAASTSPTSTRGTPAFESELSDLSVPPQQAGYLYTPPATAASTYSHSSHSSHTPSPPLAPSQPPAPSRAYACPLQSCGRLFTRPEHARRHARTAHAPPGHPKPYECRRCLRRFGRADNLAAHVRNTHLRDDAWAVKVEEDHSHHAGDSGDDEEKVDYDTLQLVEVPITQSSALEPSPPPTPPSSRPSYSFTSSPSLSSPRSSLGYSNNNSLFATPETQTLSLPSTNDFSNAFTSGYASHGYSSYETMPAAFDPFSASAGQQPRSASYPGYYPDLGFPSTTATTTTSSPTGYGAYDENQYAQLCQ